MSTRPARPPTGIHAPAPPSPVSITSRPVRARMDKIKAEMSADFQRRLGRDATWNEVLERLIAAYDAPGAPR